MSYWEIKTGDLVHFVSVTGEQFPKDVGLVTKADGPEWARPRAYVRWVDCDTKDILGDGWIQKRFLRRVS